MTKAKIELPPKLVDVFTGEARYRGAYGGRGSGKTRSFATMAAVRGYQLAMAGQVGQILCVREFQNSLADSSFTEIVAAIESVPWLKNFYDVGRNYIRTKCGRIEFNFAGLRHNIDSIKSKGRVHLCWADEAENISEEAWSKLLPTVREDGSEVWPTWNPESEDSATHKRFRENMPEGAKIVELNWQDNPWFPEVLNQERINDKNNRPETYDWIWEGGFNDNKVGSIYAKYIIEAKEGGRVTKVPYKVGVPVITAWDLGKSDSTSIWFAQVVGFEVRIIDFYETNQEDLAHYARIVREKPYEYAMHYLPHDSKHERLGMKGSIKDQLRTMGLKCEALPIGSIKSGIELGRQLLKTCYIDVDKCEQGLKALRNYKYQYDDKRKTFLTNPLHDWTSNASDALRYLAQALEAYNPEAEAEDPIDYENYNYGSEGWMNG